MALSDYYRLYPGGPRDYRARSPLVYVRPLVSPSVRAAFEYYDDGSGLLDAEGVRLALSYLGAHVSTSEALALVRAYAAAVVGYERASFERTCSLPQFGEIVNHVFGVAGGPGTSSPLYTGAYTPSYPHTWPRTHD